LGVDINEVSETLKISSEYLLSIENDLFDKLPVAVYTVGYIRCYAKYLEIDAGPVIANFTSHLASPKPSTIIPVSSFRRKVPLYVYAILLLLAALSVIAYYSFAGKNQTSGSEVEKAGPSVKRENITPAVTSVLNSAPVQKPEVKNSEAQEQSLPAVAGGDEHQLGITASDTAWVRIRFEDGKQEEMTLRSGESKNWKFGGPAVLKIGNAGGINLKFDGKDLGVQGEPGKVVDLTLPQS